MTGSVNTLNHNMLEICFALGDRRRKNSLLSNKGASLNAVAEELLAENSSSLLPGNMTHRSITLDPEHLALFLKVLYRT